jgi:hypothetical protein
MTREEAIQMLRLYEVNEIGEGELKTWYHGIDKDIREALDMAIEAIRHDVIFEQIKWERDVAIAQLEEYDIPFGMKKDEDIVKVARCRDCCYQVHCYQTVSHTKTHDGFKEYWSEPIDFCSRGERKEE